MSQPLFLSSALQQTRLLLLLLPLPSLLRHVLLSFSRVSLSVAGFFRDCKASLRLSGNQKSAAERVGGGGAFETSDCRSFGQLVSRLTGGRADGICSDLAGVL